MLRGYEIRVSKCGPRGEHLYGWTVPIKAGESASRLREIKDKLASCHGLAYLVRRKLT